MPSRFKSRSPLTGLRTKSSVFTVSLLSASKTTHAVTLPKKLLSTGTNKSLLSGPRSMMPREKSPSCKPKLTKSKMSAHLLLKDQSSQRSQKRMIILLSLPKLPSCWPTRTKMTRSPNKSSMVCTINSTSKTMLVKPILNFSFSTATTTD